jgi:hypothetical protein
MRSRRQRRVVSVLFLFAAVAGCARAVGPERHFTEWTGLMNSPLPNLLVCGAGSGFQTSGAQMSGLGVIARDNDHPEIITIRNPGSSNMAITLGVATFAFSPAGCTGGTAVPMSVAYQPRYTAHINLATGCVAASALDLRLYTTTNAPPVWEVAINNHLRTQLHMRLDDWAAAAAAVTPGAPPAPLPAAVGSSRCADYHEL